MNNSKLKLGDFDLDTLLEQTEEENTVHRTSLTDSSSHAVAIIGMDGRVGAAENLEQFWQLLCAEQIGVRLLPEKRRSEIEQFLSAKGIKTPLPDHCYIRSSYLTDVAGFDSKFFGLSQQEANYMDPNQRIFLETACKALEDAGYGGEDIRGSHTGIFVGFSSDFGEDYRRIVSTIVPNAPEVAVSGNIKSIIASRLAYLLDLRGPALLVDTACSSGLVAVYLACRAIRNGECSMAIAGGTKIDLIPIVEMGEQGVGIKDIQETFSRDQRTRTFDRDGDGTTGAEGSFAFVLKSLDQALKDGDTVRAVILGGAINQDGASNGITAPNSEAQEDLIVRALEDASVSAESISYIEAHGTATRLGDPIEISGIQRAFNHFTEKRQFCAIGSVKTNIGHLDNGAGLAGLAKLALSLQNKVLPASLNFSIPNPNISFIDSPVFVQDRTTAWPAEEHGVLRAGINSFGLSGTNCHLVLEAAPETVKRSREQTFDKLFLPLSAHDFAALQALAEAYGQRLVDPSVDLVDAAFTAARGRLHHRYRVAVLFDSREQLCTALNRFASLGKDALPHEALLYGEHERVEDGKKRRRPNDLTEQDKKKLEKEAVELLNADGRIRAAHTWKRLAELYVTGADLPWERLFKGVEARQIPLPTYPFQHVRCWVDGAALASRQEKPRAQMNKADKHPLLNGPTVTTMGHTIICNRLDEDECWELNEHRVHGVSLLPGTAFVEMIAQYARSLKEQQAPLTATDIIFLQPFTVEEGQSKELHMLIEEEGNKRQITFASRSTDGAWIVHAEARLPYESEFTEKQTHPTVDVHALKKGLHQRIPLETSVDSVRGLELGERWYGSYADGWMNVERSEFLFEFKLPQKYVPEARLYHLHPALMDVAVNAANHLVSNKHLYLPLSYGELHIYQPLPAQFYAHLKQIEGSPESSVHRFNMTLYAPDGTELVRVENYCIKSASDVWKNISEAYGYHPVFRAYSHPEPQQLSAGSILVAGRPTPTVEKLIEHFQSNGNHVLRVTSDKDHWPTVLEQFGDETLSLAIFSWAPTEQEALPEHWEKEASEAVYEGFRFLKAWAKTKVKAELGIIALTYWGWQVTSERETLYPGQAALAGLWQAAALEFEQLKLRCIDYDDKTEIETLVKEFAHIDRPAFLAYRNNQAYKPGLEPYPLATAVSGETQLPADDGVCLVSGGTGDLGTELAAFLGRQGVRRLVLLGHRQPPPREQWEPLLATTTDERLKRRLETWLELERKLDVFAVHSVKLDDYKQLSALLSDLRLKYGPVKGVFHLAGNAGDGYIFHKDERIFQNVYAPKAIGAYYLHQATLEDQPDVFVMFSSIASLEINPGQSDYTAANMFLDALAHYRAQNGWKALSLQWPAWRETGIAHRLGTMTDNDAYLPLNTDEALDILERVLRSGNDLPAVLMPGKLRKGLVPSASDTRRTSADSQATDKRVILLGILEPDDIVQNVANIWGKTLALNEVDADEDFSRLGGNSLLATQMLREYERLYPGVIDIADLFTYTTVREQANHLKSRLPLAVQNASVAEAERARPYSAATTDKPEKAAPIDADMSLDDLLESVSRGEISVDESATRIDLERGNIRKWSN